MSWTKRELINSAFEEIGFANYVFDLQPEQLLSALNRLDSMMATWNTKGIRVGYPLPSSPSQSNIDADSGIPDAAYEAVVTNLGIRLAPTVGKMVSSDTKMAARESYKTLLSWSMTIPQKQLAKTNLGAGNKPDRYTYRQFTKVPEVTLDAGKDSVLELE